MVMLLGNVDCILLHENNDRVNLNSNYFVEVILHSGSNINMVKLFLKFCISILSC